MSFIKNIWYAAAWSNEIVATMPFACTIAGHSIVLYRLANGDAAALEDRCSHRCAPLSKGRVEGDSLRCWYHGLLFGANGECQEMPGQSTVAHGFDVHSYPLVEKEGCIWLWPGDPALADPAMILHSRLDENGLDFRTGWLDYETDYQLINDNLCDFSHVSYVHEKTLGQGMDDWAQRLPILTNLDNGIRSTRWIEGARLYPLPGLPSQEWDSWTSYDYLIPGVLNMEIQFYPLGMAKAFNFDRPPSNEKSVYNFRTIQMATPISEGRTRYLFSTSLPVSPSPEALDVTFSVFKVAFVEDRDMIEAQHTTILKHPEVQLRNTAHDTGLMRIRRLITSRLRDENRKESVAAIVSRVVT